MSRWVVVLAGGVGSRFWPVSSPERPKQLLPLVTETPLLVEAVDRLRPIVDPARILILTNDALAPTIRGLFQDVPAENVIAEPRPVGTAAALTWGALTIAERDGMDASMICVHADWAIGDDDKFRATLLDAEAVARSEHALVTVGIVPTRADPGFGYIRPARSTGIAAKVEQFVEKPTRARAAEMREKGYLWNSGIFVWRAGDFLDEVREHTPELGTAIRTASGATPAEFFSSVVMPVTVDVGVLERSRNVMVVPGEFGWDDIGTWAALSRVRMKDELGNVTSGDVHLLDCSDNVVHVESGEVVMFGVKDLVVVTKGQLTLVTTTDKASDLKRLVESLSASERGIS